jgi:hypothetical protein
MRGFRLLAAFVFVAGRAAAEDAVSPIRDFDIATVEKLGGAMQDQDCLAWMAGDALNLRFSEADKRAQKVHGWVVAGNVVSMVRDGEAGPEILCEVTFADGKPSACADPADRTLHGEELAQYRARMLAIGNVKRPCSEHYNTIALKDPEHEGWLVWAMAATSDPDKIVVGGHYRFSISADGASIVQADALSHSCLILNKPKPERDMMLSSVFVTHVVSPRPVETHVFASLAYGFAFDVGTNDGRTWRVSKGRIAEASMDDQGSDGFAARMYAGHEEICNAILTREVDGKPKYFIGSTMKVIEPTEKVDKLVVEPSGGGTVVSVSCMRDDLAPAPNDYKVLLSGYGLYIMQRGTKISGELTLKDGKAGFAIKGGGAPDPVTQQRIDARLSAFQAKLDKH